MRLREWVRPPRHLLLLFAAITSVSTIALGWSIWQLVQQDRALATQRAQEQRDAVAAVALTALEKRLASVEQTLTRISAADTDLSAAGSAYLHDLPPGAVVLRVRDDGVEAYPAG